MRDRQGSRIAEGPTVEPPRLLRHRGLRRGLAGDRVDLLGKDEGFGRHVCGRQPIAVVGRRSFRFHDHVFGRHVRRLGRHRLPMGPGGHRHLPGQCGRRAVGRAIPGSPLAAAGRGHAGRVLRAALRQSGDSLLHDRESAVQDRGHGRCAVRHRRAAVRADPAARECPLSRRTNRQPRRVLGGPAVRGAGGCLHGGRRAMGRAAMALAFA